MDKYNSGAQPEHFPPSVRIAILPEISLDPEAPVALLLAQGIIRLSFRSCPKHPDNIKMVKDEEKRKRVEQLLPGTPTG